MLSHFVDASGNYLGGWLYQKDAPQGAIAVDKGPDRDFDQKYDFQSSSWLDTRMGKCQRRQREYAPVGDVIDEMLRFIRTNFTDEQLTPGMKKVLEQWQSVKAKFPTS